MNFKISYAITACNEHEELTELLSFLLENKRPEDEVVLQIDQSSYSQEIKQVADSFGDLIAKTEFFPLDNDFAKFKNNLKTHCTGDYIFQLDADELPGLEIVQNLHLILDANPEVDLFVVPRVNTVSGLTEEHISKWNWRVNEQNWVNWPDYQYRIFKNLFNIKWQNKVHEVIVGANTMSQLPAEEKFSILHHKKIDKQEKQNSFYETIS
jgi:hypothetical protein